MINNKPTKSATWEILFHPNGEKREYLNERIVIHLPSLGYLEISYMKELNNAKAIIENQIRKTFTIIRSDL